MSPYIGVDKDNKEFDPLLVKWSEYLKHLLRNGCHVRTARKYDGFMIRGTYFGLIDNKHTIGFHERKGKECFEVELDQCPDELKYALKTKGFILYAEAITSGNLGTNSQNFVATSTAINNKTMTKLIIKIIWVGNDKEQCSPLVLEQLCQNSSTKMEAIKWDPYKGGLWELNKLKNTAETVIENNGEGMIVQVLEQNGTLWQNRLYVIKFKALIRTIALSCFQNDNDEYGYVTYKHNDTLHVQLRRINNLGKRGKGKIAAGYINMWGNNEPAVRFYVGVCDSKQYRDDCLKKIYIGMDIHCNTTTITKYTITGFKNTDTCQGIYNAIGRPEQQPQACADAHPGNDFGLFELTVHNINSKVWVCVLQLLEHIVHTSTIQIPESHKKIAKMLKCGNEDANSPINEPTQLENFLQMHEEYEQNCLRIFSCLLCCAYLPSRDSECGEMCSVHVSKRDWHCYEMTDFQNIVSLNEKEQGEQLLQLYSTIVTKLDWQIEPMKAVGHIKCESCNQALANGHFSLSLDLPLMHSQCKLDSDEQYIFDSDDKYNYLRNTISYLTNQKYLNIENIWTNREDSDSARQGLRDTAYLRTRRHAQVFDREGPSGSGSARQGPRDHSNRDGGAKGKDTGHGAGGSGKGKESALEGGNREKRKEGQDEYTDATTKRKAVVADRQGPSGSCDNAITIDD
jgi:hypothetical protein